MKPSVKISDLKVMSQPQQERRMADLVKSTGRIPNGEIRDLDDQIAKYEKKFGFDTRTLREKLATGEINETLAICDWLMLVNIRDRLVARVPRPR
jgi:hypothetical protein